MQRLKDCHVVRHLPDSSQRRGLLYHQFLPPGKDGNGHQTLIMPFDVFTPPVI